MDAQDLNEINLTGFNMACDLQRANVRLQGFPQVSIPTELMLVVTELSEAVQADRRMGTIDIRKVILDDFFASEDISYKRSIYEAYIENTIPMEIVDAIMRLMAFCGRFNIDVERLVKVKTWYNSIRPIRNGKRY